jgi:hypothetical protein
MPEKRQDEPVEIKSAPDGTVTQGHEPNAAHFERARELYEAHGSSITFQVYRINLQATSLAELQGQKHTEFTVGGDMISGDDTVETVKDKVRPSLQGNLQDGDRITFFFGGRPMRDDALFYADHFMVLPVWIQILLHDCEFKTVEEAIRKFRKPKADP